MLLEEFDKRITELVIIPSSGGVFEIEVDGHLVYSKKATGRHAEYDGVLQSVRELVGSPD